MEHNKNSTIILKYKGEIIFSKEFNDLVKAEDFEIEFKVRD